MMRAKNWIWIGIGIALLLMMLNAMGMFYPLNNGLPHSPDMSCETDDDCTFGSPDCDPGACSRTPMNRAWEPFCPFRDPRIFDLMVCAPAGVRPACVENRCVAILLNRSNST